MPPSRRTRRRQQCQWTEVGRRCTRDVGEGQALCRPHQVAAAEQQRRAQHAAARAAESNPISELVEDFFADNPFAAKAGQFLNDMGWSLGGIFGGGYSPPIDNVPPPEVPPEYRDQYRYQQHQERQQAPPPPPSEDPRVVMRARVELGYGPSDPISADSIRDRRKQLARKWHPDLAGKDEKRRRLNEERMRTINDSCDVLIASIENRNSSQRRA